jgi:hypothetical protein
MKVVHLRQKPALYLRLHARRVPLTFIAGSAGLHQEHSGEVIHGILEGSAGTIAC